MLRERERERESACTLGRSRERRGERERIPSRLHLIGAEPNVGLEPTICETIT